MTEHKACTICGWGAPCPDKCCNRTLDRVQGKPWVTVTREKRDSLDWETRATLRWPWSYPTSIPSEYSDSIHKVAGILFGSSLKGLTYRQDDQHFQLTVTLFEEDSELDLERIRISLLPYIPSSANHSDFGLMMTNAKILSRFQEQCGCE